MLGSREPEQYGHLTLDGLNTQITVLAKELGLHTEYFQSNSEDVLIDPIQSMPEKPYRFLLFLIQLGLLILVVRYGMFIAIKKNPLLSAYQQYFRRETL